MTRERIGLVLAGGGARGAYEIGALSVLLPVLEARGQRPTVMVGTSVGAINTAYLAAHAHVPATEAVSGGLEVWRSLRWDQVLAPLLAPSTALRVFSYVGEVLSVRGSRLTSVLDTAPLAETLQRVIDFERIHANVQDGLLDAAAIVGTSAATSESVVFVDGGPLPPVDIPAGLDYVATRLTVEHVRASSAIPFLFPAVHVSTPPDSRGWFLDGGVRLNAPTRPALSLHVDRIVVVGLNAIRRLPHRLASDVEPDAFAAAGVLLEGALGDPLARDVRDLARVNRLVDARSQPVAAPDGRAYRRIPFIFVNPSQPEEIDHTAERVFREHYEGREMMRAIDVALLARLIGGATDHGSLLSYLFFAPEFANALIELGRHHAEEWLEHHQGPDGPWEVASADPR